MRIAILLLTTSLGSSLAAAGESCQVQMDKVAAGLAATDKMSPVNGAAKCRAYKKVWLDSLDVAPACMHGQDELNLLESKFKPMMEQLAHGEQTFCGG